MNPTGLHAPRAMRQSDGADAGQGWQGEETCLRLAGWSRQRRIILLRRKLARDRAIADTTNAARPRLSFAEIGPDKSVALVGFRGGSGRVAPRPSL